MAYYKPPDFPQIIVMDNGSLFTKVGFAGETEPRAVFMTHIGVKIPQYYVGDELKWNFSVRIVHPVELGVIKDWGRMENLWRCVIEERISKSPI